MSEGKGGVDLTNQKIDYVQLLNAYRQLWVNRSLEFKEGETANNDEKGILYEVIKKDLLDEMTHPRVRQSPDVKLQWAVERIQNGDLEEKTKEELVSFYHSNDNDIDLESSS